MFTSASTANSQVRTAQAAATACACGRSVSVRIIDTAISMRRDTNTSGVLRSE